LLEWSCWWARLYYRRQKITLTLAEDRAMAILIHCVRLVAVQFKLGQLTKACSMATLVHYVRPLAARFSLWQITTDSMVVILIHYVHPRAVRRSLRQISDTASPNRGCLEWQPQ
jgi:hypothetical protein